MKGLLFKHPARYEKYLYLIAERICGRPCEYCDFRIKQALGCCNYIDVGVGYVHSSLTGRLIGINVRCVYKWGPAGTNYHVQEHKLRRDRRKYECIKPSKSS